MKIREIDVHDDAEFGAWYAILRSAQLFGRERMPFWSQHEAAVMMRNEEPTESWRCFAAFEGDADDEAMVGNGLVILPLLDNTHFAFIGVDVAPENRGRGIGSALLDALVTIAREAGRTHLLGEINVAFEDREHHPYRTFAEKRGFALANIEVRRCVDLPVSDETIAGWLEESAPYRVGYRLETFVDETPDELIPSLVHVINQLALDAPTGDLEFEAEAMTPEAFKIRAAKLKEMRRRTYQTVAIAPDGNVVAFTTLGVSEDDPENVSQWGTLVLREHRGHRLGIAVKALNLRAMQAAHPDHTRILTTNAETNANMVSINEQMGFKPIELLVEFQRVLDED